MKSALRSINQPFSNRVQVNGKSYLYFGGTAYLGIPQHKGFIDLYIKGISEFGLNNGTSRNNNIQLGIYNEAEHEAAKRFRAEDALITSSGYLAAQLVVKALSTRGRVVYAPATHPALWLNKQKSIDKTFGDWANETIKVINQSEEMNWVLISNSMNNLFPEVYDFTFLTKVNKDKNIILIVDDSHGIGINNNGLSAYSGLPKQPNINSVLVASMAKALGVDAGLVLGSKEIINQLKNTNEFLGASPPSAAGLYAFAKAEDIYREEWEKLQYNIQILTPHLSSKWKYAEGFPAFYLDDEHIADELQSHQILISSFPYPDQYSKPVNRIVLSSWHQKKDLEQLAESIVKF